MARYNSKEEPCADCAAYTNEHSAKYADDDVLATQQLTQQNDQQKDIPEGNIVEENIVEGFEFPGPKLFKTKSKTHMVLVVLLLLLLAGGGYFLYKKYKHKENVELQFGCGMY